VYRSPSRGPCIGIIYTHPSRVGGIQALFSPTISLNVLTQRSKESHHAQLLLKEIRTLQISALSYNNCILQEKLYLNFRRTYAVPTRNQGPMILKGYQRTT